MAELNLTDNIIELNRDIEPFVIQGATSRPRAFKDAYVPLQFVHFSDVHTKLELWNRMVEYINHYEKYISFALHSGDYCGSSQLEFKDFYAEADKCVKPIYNCVGNHDVEENEDWRQRKPKKATKQSTWEKLFYDQEGWDATFMEGEWSMTYYKDFPESCIRLVVLDLYYDIEQQKEWLREVLADAKEKGLHVITSTHEPSAHISNYIDTTFNTPNFDAYTKLCGKDKTTPFEEVFIEFINGGGTHVCNFVGHWHHDRFGFTEGGVLNCAVECATSWNGWCDGVRVKGTRTFDCFNVVSVDANIGILKLARVGDNVDHYMRGKQSLCFDYINKKLIYSK